MSSPIAPGRPRPTIRDFLDADWSEVWPVVEEVVRAGDTYTYDPATDEPTARSLWLTPAPGRTTVALVDDRLLGTAKMHANRPGPGDHVATASFMVSRDARGLGVGRAMVLDALGWARGQGFAGMQFNAVAASNVHAVGLYQRLGFDVVGRVPGGFRHPSQGKVDLLVMYCALDRPGSGEQPVTGR